MALSLDEALGMSLADEADESIHVDIDTRQVTIPESQQVFGVESDEDVEVKHIVIDGRYADGTDLSTFTFRVNYQNANGDKGTYLATELKVNDSSIEFDWVIGRQVVAYKGTIAFIVCAYTIDSSSVIQNEWNSTLGKGTVLEGLEVSEFDFGDDIVRQLASILSDVNAAQASAKASADEAYKSKTEVVALGKEQQAAIEKKGKDALASIPEDYTQVINDVSQLKDDTAALKDGKISKFYASSQGNTNLPDSDDGRIVDLMLYGKSEQKQYSGKNLLDLRSGQSGTGEGVTYTKNADGSYIRKGTATGRNGNVWFAGGYDDLSVMPTLFTLKAGTYTVKDCCLFSGTTSYYTTFTISSDLPVTGVRNFWQDIGTTYNDTIYPMVLVGDTDTGWEPYVGGIPSPNPEYPQEIKSVVKPSVKVCGKNLVGELMPGVIVWNTGDHISSEAGYACTDFIPVKPGEKYTISNATTSAERWYYDSNKKPVIGMPTGNITVTIPENIDYMRVTCLTENKDKFQIELGSTATAYEPYTEQTVTLPYTLNAIPVTSGGNVTIDGQQYIADYVDVEKGKLVRMVEECDLADLTWEVGKNEYDGFYKTDGLKSLILKPSSNSVAAILLTDEYKKYSWNAITSSNIGIAVGAGIGDHSGGMVIVSNQTTGLPKGKLVYALATPTETNLTADEIAAFKALVSHYPVTNVSTTSDQLDGYTVFDYPISLANGWNYVKQQLGDTRDYLYGIDLMTAEAYVNSEYAAALAEIEV